MVYLRMTLAHSKQWLKYKKFVVGTPIRERLATPIRGVRTLMCQKLEVWERRSRPFPLTLNTDSKDQSQGQANFDCNIW